MWRAHKIFGSFDFQHWGLVESLKAKGTPGWLLGPGSRSQLGHGDPQNKLQNLLVYKGVHYCQ